MNQDQKLKISVEAKQHAMDWGTGFLSREHREHSYRIGEKAGYQRAIDNLNGHKFIEACEHGVDPAFYLKENE